MIGQKKPTMRGELINTLTPGEHGESTWWRAGFHLHVENWSVLLIQNRSERWRCHFLINIHFVCSAASMFSREPFVSVELVQAQRGRLSQAAGRWIYILWCNWVWLELVLCSCSSCLYHQINQRCADRLMTSSQETSGNIRKHPETSGNIRKQPETAGNSRKQPETAGNSWKQQETAGNSRKQLALRRWMRRDEMEAEKLQMRSDDGKFNVLYITD